MNAANAYSAARTAVAPQQGSEALARVGQAAEDFAAQLAGLAQTADGRPRDLARFPVPNLKPLGGFRVDPPVQTILGR